MNTKSVTQEQISAFADGEMLESHPEAVLAALRQQEARCAWDVYHHIGDVLRSDDMAFALRPDFAARMAARLEAEPTIVAPQPASAPIRQRFASGRAGTSMRLLHRFRIAGAAAAVAAVAFIAAPPLMVALSGSGAGAGTAVVASSALAGSSAGTTETRSEVVAVNAQDGVILRDPRIDDYLFAHQRFSPSVYSTAQYARSAAFSNDSGK